MARIRSVHPGFFTDENLVSVSMAARLLFIGLGVEADDKGVFEWKPLTIKMKVFPGDNIEVQPLLAELEGVEAIQKYEIGGRFYGAIRNFRKFQRPKTPNDIYPATAEIIAFVGMSADEATLIPPKVEAFLPKGEKSPQMEDEGGKRELVKESDDSSTKRAEPFPRPDFVTQPLWDDFKKNRKAKRTPNTATAHAKMMADLAHWSNETGWPPGEVFRACVAKGWAGIYDPRDKNDGQHGNQNDGLGRTERAAERLKQQLSGGAGRTEQGAAGFAALQSGTSNRTIDAEPHPMRAIGHVR